MKFTVHPSVLLLALCASKSHGFTATHHQARAVPRSVGTFSSAPRAFLATPNSLRTTRKSSGLAASASKDEDEVERLRSMAAKLRAEAAALEAEQTKQMAAAAEKAFQKFDTNQDGRISFEELKEGLEKTFKLELPEKRVKKLMADFDKTGDGSLALEEFVGVDKFRNKLDALAREERALALEKSKQAKQEEEISKVLQAQLEMINDKPPTLSDKLLSVLPYLFPLLDGLQFARFLVMENPDSALSAIVTVLYGLYRLIPFGGFIAFIALNTLSGNTRINRLIRFNMQQAIFLDIALFFPGLLAALYGLVASGGFALPAGITEIGSDVLLATMLLSLSYCVISSLFGVIPDKIPLISDAVSARMPTADNIKVIFMPDTKLDDDKKDDKPKDS